LRGGQVWSAPLQLDDGRTGCIDIELELESDPQLSLDEHGVLHAQVNVNGWAWVGERWTEVPTATGTQQMRLRRAHRRYRLAGQGVPAAPGSARGDLIVHVHPVFPETLDAESEALIDRLIARSGGQPQGHSAGTTGSTTDGTSEGASESTGGPDDSPPGRQRQGANRRRRAGDAGPSRSRGES
jgi:DnaJ-class molecular chaperone